MPAACSRRWQRNPPKLRQIGSARGEVVINFALGLDGTLLRARVAVIERQFDTRRGRARRDPQHQVSNSAGRLAAKPARLSIFRSSFAEGLSAPWPLARPLDELKPTYDVVIVGSGYGGGVAASRLSRAGKRVAVLERGREVETGGFPSKFPELRAEMRVTGKRMSTGSETALFDVRLGDDMHVLVGRGLGGGSLVNAGVSLRPDARVFADPVWPGQIRQDGLLDEGYRRAEAWLRPASDPQASSLTKFQSLAKAGAALGVTPVAPRVAVSFADTVNAAGIAQSACTRCGDCCAGCNVGAKNTVALTYLPDAKAHGAELFTHAKVSHVGRAADGTWVVHFTRLDRPAAPETQTVSAAQVILSAGTLGSAEILLRSRDKGLKVSDRLGQRFSANGDIIAFGYGAKIPINGIGVGHPAKVEIAPVGASVAGQLEIRDA